MGKNKVTIDVNLYDLLREKERALDLFLKSKTAIIHVGYYDRWNVLTEDKAVKKIADELIKEQEKNKKLRSQILDVKLMSIWKFIKLRKSVL